MKCLRILLAAFAARCVGATRLAEDNEETTAAKDRQEPQVFAEELEQKFANPDKYPESRPNLAAIRQTEIAGGSSGKERKYKYLGTTCMQQRANYSAEVFANAGCKRILEVGGFHTPLPTIVDKSKMPSTLQMYVDVDPSAEKTKIEDFCKGANGKPYACLTLQIILDEFRAKKKGSDEVVHIGTAFDCFLMLGTTAQNVGTPDKKKALHDAISTAHMAIIEWPSSNPDTPGHFEGVVEQAGMAKDDSLSKVVDCRDDEEAKKAKGENCGISAADDECLERNIYVYGRESAKQKKKKKELDDFGVDKAKN
eukprot:TRINITY_DN92842_c0_g1_i1.p1 TRINITY_DN92842_c0_g1~~TRINITY_DN92842_c0_g1_i1.p1  ORF type:complete len:310 (-),score=97.46 TRINITY_DN92842_c0_g1_i1:159-1088(-)